MDDLDKRLEQDMIYEGCPNFDAATTSTHDSQDEDDDPDGVENKTE